MQAELQLTTWVYRHCTKNCFSGFCLTTVWCFHALYFEGFPWWIGFLIKFEIGGAFKWNSWAIVCRVGYFGAFWCYLRVDQEKNYLKSLKECLNVVFKFFAINWSSWSQRKTRTWREFLDKKCFNRFNAVEINLENVLKLSARLWTAFFKKKYPNFY